ncbi:MAG TPA: hypothetical protein VFO19_23165, partial [Vicinamibacterales bacterium]|nr:hypothetical protein [Vicinamibacterales bacterium]
MVVVSGAARRSRAFDVLLALFPRAFRDGFGDAMHDTFVDQRDDVRRRAGRLGVMRLWIWTAVRMTAAAWRERRASAPRPMASVRERMAGVVREMAVDARLAVRGLRRQPAFALMAIGAVAIGIGAVATIFSALNAMTLRPLAGTADGARLVGIDRRSPDFSEGASASPAFLAHLRERSRTLA